MESDDEGVVADSCMKADNPLPVPGHAVTHSMHILRTYHWPRGGARLWGFHRVDLDRLTTHAGKNLS